VPVSHEVCEFVHRHWTANKIALNHGATDCPKDQTVILALDALCRYLEIQRFAKRNERMHQRCVFDAVAEICDEGPIDLEAVERELFEISDG